MKLTTFKEHLEKQYGKVGTAKREEFDKNSKAFARENQLAQTQFLKKK